MPGCFPPGILLRGDLGRGKYPQGGQSAGKRRNYYGVDAAGTPNVNIHRDPSAEGLFEGYLRTPAWWLKLPPELAQRRPGGGSTCQSQAFAANNQETDRRGVDETVKRALYEIYSGFRACIQEGKARRL